MKGTLKRLAQPLAERLFKRLTGRSVAEAAKLTKRPELRPSSEAALKRPIRLLFVCHMPALWSMFDTIYRAAAEDRDFQTIVVTLPCMHPNVAPGRYTDLGMHDYLRGKGIKAVEGYHKDRDVWLTPESFAPDYVLFQTPYNLFPQRWSAQNISTFAHVCYVPYATTLFRGDVDEIVHPEQFFSATALVFSENVVTRRRLIDRFKSRPWFRDEAFVVCGSP